MYLTVTGKKRPRNGALLRGRLLNCGREPSTRLGGQFLEDLLDVDVGTGRRSGDHGQDGLRREGVHRRLGR
jgi:hypothetical protein